MATVERTLNFLLEEPNLSFRAIRRKGALRWIASNRRGSLGAMTKFAPPSKCWPRLMVQLCSLIDFRVPRFVRLVEPLDVSGTFFRQATALLQIPVDRVGIYVGEPNDQQKLVVTDVGGQSGSVLKIAAGKKANRAIEREAMGASLAREDAQWQGMVPEIRPCEPISGKPTLLIERIRGRQLSPSAFEQMFMQPTSFPAADGVVLGDWLMKNGYIDRPDLTELLDSCDQIGALSLCSPLGIVHGDFAPWNAIQTEDRIVFVDWEFSGIETPRIFDTAYAAWCYSELLGREIRGIEKEKLDQLVALGALWREIRK